MTKDQTLIQLYRSLDAAGREKMESLYPADTFKSSLPLTVQDAVLTVQSYEENFDIPVGAQETVQAFIDMLFVEAAINQGARGTWSVLVNGDGRPFSIPIFAHQDTALFRLPFYFKSYDEAAHVANTFQDTFKALVA